MTHVTIATTTSYVGAEAKHFFVPDLPGMEVVKVKDHGVDPSFGVVDALSGLPVGHVLHDDCLLLMVGLEKFQHSRGFGKR